MQLSVFDEVFDNLDVTSYTADIFDNLDDSQQGMDVTEKAPSRSPRPRSRRCPPLHHDPAFFPVDRLVAKLASAPRRLLSVTAARSRHRGS